jgi:hypothetical protein
VFGNNYFRFWQNKIFGFGKFFEFGGFAAMFIGVARLFA